MSQDKSPDMNL